MPNPPLSPFESPPVSGSAIARAPHQASIPGTRYDERTPDLRHKTSRSMPNNQLSVAFRLSHPLLNHISDPLRLRLRYPRGCQVHGKNSQPDLAHRSVSQFPAQLLLEIRHVAGAIKNGDG